MLAEIETYNTALRAADTLHVDELHRLETDCNSNKITYETYRDCVRPLTAERGEAYQAAKDTLDAVLESWRGSAELEHRQAVFILDTCYREYLSESIMVLGILPATGAQLRALSQSNSWCDVFRRFYERAEEAGVIPGVDPLDPAQKAWRNLDRWLNGRFTYEENKTKVRALVDAIVAAEVAKGAAPQGVPADAFGTEPVSAV
jgi:hypothetical protein